VPAHRRTTGRRSPARCSESPEKPSAR
jgi:hypothetical protein